MIDKIREALTPFMSLSDSEWRDFSTAFSTKTFKANELLVRQGQVSRYIYFIEKGLMRTYHIIKGKEVSTYFSCDHQFISTFASFITQTPSLEFLETIEESTVLYISFEALEELYTKHPNLEKIGRYLAEQNYLCVINRTVSMQTKSSREKYVDFIENNPKKIVLRTPQHMVASFLGITPESLSRTKKQLLIS